MFYVHHAPSLSGMQIYPKRVQNKTKARKEKGNNENPKPEKSPTKPVLPQPTVRCQSIKE